MTARPGPSHMQHHAPGEHTAIAFMLGGEQWGERGDFSGPPKVAMPKAEQHLRFMVNARVWPKGLWRLVPDRGVTKEVRVR